MLYNADTLEEFKNYAPKPGFILTSWCGNQNENHVKDIWIKSRCIPDDQQVINFVQYVENQEIQIILWKTILKSIY